MGRRVESSRTTRSRPHVRPRPHRLAADEQAGQVVPAVEGAALRPPGRRRARLRRRRSTRATPRRGPGTGPSPGGGRETPRSPRWRRRGPCSPRDNGPAVLLGPAAAHGGVARAGGLVGHHADPWAFRIEHADAGGVERHAPVRVGRAVDRVDHGQEPGRTVAGHPGLLREHGQAGSVEHGQRRAVGGQVEAILPRLAPARPPVLQARRARRARRGPPRRALRGAGRRPRVGTLPAGSPSPPGRPCPPRPLGFPSCGCH